MHYQKVFENDAFQSMQKLQEKGAAWMLKLDVNHGTNAPCRGLTRNVKTTHILILIRIKKKLQAKTPHHDLLRNYRTRIL